MNKEPFEHRSPDPDRWEALARYLAGESTPAEANDIQAWLAADPRRQELLTSLDDSLRKLTATGIAPVDVEAALRSVKARLHDPVTVPLRPRPANAELFKRPWSRTLIRLAATIIVVLGVSLIWRASIEKRGAGVSRVAQVFATGIGQTDSLQLMDGTTVVLAPGSRLTLAAGYGSRSREVELNGEAFFDVKHDAKQPFSVHAGAATIRDLGTAFVVRNTLAHSVRVAVTSGSVILQPAQGREADGVVLRAGDRGLLDQNGKAVAERGHVTDDDLAFTSGRLVFADATLEEVAAQLARWYGIHLRIADPELASRHVTATFDGERAQQVLDVIALTLGARVELKGDTAFVRTAR